MKAQVPHTNPECQSPDRLMDGEVPWGPDVVINAVMHKGGVGEEVVQEDKVEPQPPRATRRR